MNNRNTPEFHIYEFYDYILKYKLIILFSFLIPFFLSLFFYYYQNEEIEYQVFLNTNEKLSYQSEESVSIQNINMNYQILRSINISRDLLIRMTEDINPVGIISANNYLVALEDIITNSNKNIIEKFKNLRAISVLENNSNHIIVKYILHDNQDAYNEIYKINLFLNNQTLKKLKTTFKTVDQQFRKLTEIGNLGAEDNGLEITNNLLFSEIEKVFEKYQIFSNKKNFFINEDKTKILLVKNVKFKPVFIFIIPLVAMLFLCFSLFLKDSFKGYLSYKSAKKQR